MLKKLANRLKRLSVVNKVVVAISCVVFCWYSIPRAIATFGSFVAHEPSLSYDYSNFEDLLPSSNSSLSKIRDGIPHGFQESGSFYIALWFTFAYRFDGMALV